MCYFWLAGLMCLPVSIQDSLSDFLEEKQPSPAGLLQDVLVLHFLCHSLSSAICVINQTVILMKCLYITPYLLFEHRLFSGPEHLKCESVDTNLALAAALKFPFCINGGEICILLSFLCGGVIPWHSHNASLIKHNMIGIPHIMYSFSRAGRWFMIS